VPSGIDPSIERTISSPSLVVVTRVASSEFNFLGFQVVGLGSPSLVQPPFSGALWNGVFFCMGFLSVLPFRSGGFFFEEAVLGLPTLEVPFSRLKFSF